MDERQEKDLRLRYQEEFDKRYATKEEVKPIKALVFGFVLLVLTAVVGALIALVVK